MAVVALCSAAGSTGTTTTSLFVAGMLAADHQVLLAECDPSGGDLAAWAQLPIAPGWSTAVSAHDRSFDAVVDNVQQLPNGLHVLTAPARTGAAAATVPEAAAHYGSVLGDRNDLVAVADCGRIGQVAPVWAGPARLTLLVVRQITSAAAPNVAVVDRALEALDVLGGSVRKVGVVLIGARPYPPAEIEAALGVPLFALLPDDPHAAAAAMGGFSLARRSMRTPLGRAAATLAARVAEVVGVPPIRRRPQPRPAPQRDGRRTRRRRKGDDQAPSPADGEPQAAAVPDVEMSAEP